MWNCISKSNKTTDYKRKLLKRMVKESKECFLQDKEAASTQLQNNNDDRDIPKKQESSSSLTLVILSIMKCLDKEELSALDTAVEWGNSGVTPCVHLKSNDWPHISASKCKLGSIDPVYAVCFAWRWSNLSPKEKLLSLCACVNSSDESVICINPFHYSRITKDAASIMNGNSDMKKAIESIINQREKQTTFLKKCLSTIQDLDCDSQLCSCEEDGPLPARPWSTISYWELLHHVRNSWLPVSDRVFHVFSQLHTGNGLCVSDVVGPYSQSAHYNHPALSCQCTGSSGNLRDNKSCCGSSLGGNNYSSTMTSGYWIPNAAEKVQIQRCREKIGAGITLLRESQPACPHDYKVWVYNRSEQPVFVSSPTLFSSESNWENNSNSLPPLVVRLQPGYSTLAFDSIAYEALQSLRIYKTVCHSKQIPPSSANILPSHPGESMNRKVIHVSFGKGWGRNYRRQDVTMCPCRLEIIMADDKREC